MITTMRLRTTVITTRTGGVIITITAMGTPMAPWTRETGATPSA